MGILRRSESRDGARVIWLAVHSTEGNDQLRVNDAVTLRDADWWEGSSHAICDNEALLTPAEGCVPYERAAWTLRGGNRYSDNIEQVGWARWTRDEWLAHPGTLDHTARWLADRSKARGIPLVHLTPTEVAQRKPGVIGHVDYTLGTGDGSHTDPGPGYPWDVVTAKARAYANGTQEDDMTPEQDARLKEIRQILMRQVPGGVQDIHNLSSATLTETRALRAAVTALASNQGLDGDAILAKIAESVDAALADVEITLSAKPDA